MVTEDGLNYRITHERAQDSLGEISDYGGKTIAEIIKVEGSAEEPEYKVLATGVAACSDKDRFDRRRGRTIAMGRARVELLGRRKHPAPTV